MMGSKPAVSGPTLIVSTLLLPMHALVSGLVTRFLYHRLLAPTFPMLPQHIGIAQALGLTIFVTWLTMDESSIAADERSFGEREAAWLVHRGLIVVLALIVGWWMP